MRSIGHWTIRLLALGAIAYAMACGGADGAGGPSCVFALVVTPSEPVRGDTVELTAIAGGDASGIEEVEWSVLFDGAPVVFEIGGANGDEVVFPAGEAGVYDIAVSGSIGGIDCTGDSRQLNVSQAGAIVQSMRLLIVSREGSILPPQTFDFDLPGGAPYSLSTVSVAEGALTAVNVLGPGGDPLAGAYLRAVPLGEDAPDLWVERFSQEDGLVNLRLVDGAHRFLVVPEADLPAVYLSARPPADLGGRIDVDEGISVTGTVEDGAGDPVVGARVQITVAGAPSTIGTTDAGGAFTLAARAGSPIAVSVTPSEASGLPALEVPEDGLPIDDGANLAIHYDASVVTRSVSPVLRETDGATPAAGARVTFIARSIAGAGTVSVDGTPLAAHGELVRTAQANGSGVIPAQELTATRYDIIVEPGPSAPAGQGVRFELLDLRTGQGAPASLRLAAPAHLTGQVVDADGAPVEGARLTAVATGLLSRATAAGAADATVADGTFNLAVAAGARYQVRIDGPGGAGRLYQVVDAPPVSSGDLGAPRLPRALTLTGSLAVAGGNPVGGALVQLQCLTCGPDGGPAAVAEAVSDPAGDFALLAPDPGVAE